MSRLKCIIQCLGFIGLWLALVARGGVLSAGVAVVSPVAGVEVREWRPREWRRAVDEFFAVGRETAGMSWVLMGHCYAFIN